VPCPSVPLSFPFARWLHGMPATNHRRPRALSLHRAILVGISAPSFPVLLALLRRRRASQQKINGGRWSQRGGYRPLMDGWMDGWLAPPPCWLLRLPEAICHCRHSSLYRTGPLTPIYDTIGDCMSLPACTVRPSRPVNYYLV